MKYYVVELCIGDYADMSYKILFITDMEYKAKWYCSKGNKILKKYIEYYHSFYEADEDINWYHYYTRYNFANGLFTYTVTEARTEFKGIKP